MNIHMNKLNYITITDLITKLRYLKDQYGNIQVKLYEADIGLQPTFNCVMDLEETCIKLTSWE